MLPSAERGRSGGGRGARKAPTNAAWATTPQDHRPLPSNDVPTHDPSPVFMRWISAIRIEETSAIAVARSPCAGPGTPGGPPS